MLNESFIEPKKNLDHFSDRLDLRQAGRLLDNPERCSESPFFCGVGKSTSVAKKIGTDQKKPITALPALKEGKAVSLIEMHNLVQPGI